MDKNLFMAPGGNRRTKALFYETSGTDKSHVLYTLKDYKYEGFPSLYELYMEGGDLTEYEFANFFLGGWEHWQQITQCSWFKPYVKRWREELHLQVSAVALRQIKRIASTNEPGSMTANKYLLEKGWTKNTDPVGRPSRAAIKKKAAEMVEDTARVDHDHARIFARGSKVLDHRDNLVTLTLHRDGPQNPDEDSSLERCAEAWSDD